MSTPQNPYGQPAPGWPPRQQGEPAGYERPPVYGEQPWRQPEPQPGAHRQHGNGYGPPMPPQQPPRKKHTFRNVVLGVAAFIIVVIAISTALADGKSPAPAPAAAASSPAGATSPAAAPAAAAPRVIATFTGSGIENTARFAAPRDYILKWSYDCAATGTTGNFIVSGDGGSDLSGASVNELGNGGHGETHVYGDAGSHYLGIDSECSWTAQVIG